VPLDKNIIGFWRSCQKSAKIDKRYAKGWKTNAID